MTALRGLWHVLQGRLCLGLLALWLFSSTSVLAQRAEGQSSTATVAASIIYNPAFVSTSPSSRLSMVQSYLSKNSQALQLPADLSNLSFVRMRKSLVGEHYYFQMKKNNLDVLHEEVIVSIKKSSAKIYRVFAHTSGYHFRENESDTSTPAITEERAIAIAWKDLRVHGDLLAKPRVSLLYVPRGENYVLVYHIRLAVARPFGYWEYQIDASTGTILDKTRQELSRKAQGAAPAGLESMAPAWDYEETRQRFLLREQRDSRFEEEADKNSTTHLVNGRGLVFNPDPRTALLNPLLQVNSPRDMFENAYEEVSLPEIMFNGRTHLLSGPHVVISDFEPPHTPPSTSIKGIWQAKRGDNAFNDVMVYFHIDRSQRYLRTLGFDKDLAVVDYALGADSDALGGDDNSHFVPELGRLAFGHGCVPDTEDGDVIVHEYAHAIQADLAPHWSGGDSGAMGEGFGDYWAASSRLDTPNGFRFQAQQIFHWDSNNGSTEAPCWSGRKLNVGEAEYRDYQHYDAHQIIALDQTSFIADELWSTPLYQSLLEAMRAGFDKKDIDRLLIESHFGMGAGVTMPDMARAVVQTAELLYPESGIAAIFAKNFRRHKILAP